MARGRTARNTAQTVAGAVLLSAPFRRALSTSTGAVRRLTTTTPHSPRMAPRRGGRSAGSRVSAREGAEYHFMATKRMLVDAIHPEETRIVVTNGNRLEEFDFESATRRQLRGNIYLAKVTRVEPSLQAAFVEYGGNRHGFLAFSEIHPDYYQIPVADREALLRDEERGRRARGRARRGRRRCGRERCRRRDRRAGCSRAPTEADAEADPQSTEPTTTTRPTTRSHIEQAPAERRAGRERSAAATRSKRCRERRKPPISRRNNYKIQEVIKRRQVMLVQVVKEERGNKGAALTTYLSLAGRYSVLMPNTARGGGISRKITNAADRKRLKDIVGDLEVPPGQGIILRTAGASRTKAEVKRDFEYLQRLWENVRTLTLKSVAPCLVYEEGSLIKRTIRDLYNKDIDEVCGRGRRRLPRSQGLHADDHAEPRQERAALQGRSADLLEVRRREPARPDVLAAGHPALGRLHRHQPDRGAGLDRRELGPLHQGAQYRGHGAPDQPRGRRRSRPPAAAARSRRPHRHRLHRHGREPLQPGGRAQAQGLRSRTTAPASRSAASATSA